MSDPYEGAYETVKAQEARVPVAGPHMSVRMIVAGDPDADRRCVGAMIHPELDVLLGTAPDTAADRLNDPALLSELLGMRWATPEERAALNVMTLPDDAGSGAVDGTTRANAIRGTRP